MVFKFDFEGLETFKYHSVLTSRYYMLVMKMTLETFFFVRKVPYSGIDCGFFFLMVGI